MGYFEDPFTSNRYRYECSSCGGRTTSVEPMGSCPTCGGDVQNIAVPRE